jgi:transcriptional regulator
MTQDSVSQPQRPDRHAPRTPADVAAFVRAQPLGLIVSHGEGGAITTPLPLLVETGDDGGVAEVFGHFARSNRQLAILREQPRALILFQGPHAYIPPSLVSKPDWAPTWNYALVQFEVEIRLVPEENARAIVDLAHFLEGDGPDAWRIDRMGPRFDALVKHVVAFRARVIGTHAKFKLGQDEDDRTFAEIVEGLGDTPLTRMMRRQRQPDD